MAKDFAVAPCEHCGSDPVPHGLTKFSIQVQEFFDSAKDSGEKGALSWLPDPAPFGDWLFPKLFWALSSIGAGDIVEEPGTDDMLLTQCLWEEAKKRGIRVREFRPFGLMRNLFSAEYGGKVIAYEGVPLPNDKPRSIWWLDDKAILKREFTKLGFPVPKGKACRTFAEALETFRTLNKPVIVKPHHGSATRHTTLHIKDEDALARAFEIALQVSPAAVVEEEMEGPVYRPTLVAGELVAVLRRDAAQIIGDGTHTVEELIHEANRHPKRQGPYFSTIKIIPETAAELAEQGMNLASVPREEEPVRLHQKLNWSMGGTTTDVTDGVHPDNARLFIDAAKALHAPLVGIDFIIKDIGKSWRNTPRCGVIECNSMPFFDNHHLPFEGEPRNVAAKVWDQVFPDSGAPRI